MKIKGIFVGLGLLLISLSASAQVVSKDSINMLKDQKQVLEVSKRLNDRKLELAKLENQIQEKTDEVAKTAEKAQKSADANKEAAEKLGSNPQDKSLARRASKSAGSAHRDAKKARRASDNLDKLKKNIESLRGKIADDESKLASLQGGGSGK